MKKILGLIVTVSVIAAAGFAFQAQTPAQAASFQTPVSIDETGIPRVAPKECTALSDTLCKCEYGSGTPLYIPIEDKDGSPCKNVTACEVGACPYAQSIPATR